MLNKEQKGTITNNVTNGVGYEQLDLFGVPVKQDVILRDKFIEPPFSVIDNKRGPWQVKAFMDCGMNYYNEAILLNPIASASMRAEGNMKTRKLVKIHQNILVFKKG